MSREPLPAWEETAEEAAAWDRSHWDIDRCYDTDEE